jgi:GDP/GTP exchange factor required for growth at low temperature
VVCKQKCQTLHNFNAMVAITLVLQTKSIERLASTWRGVSDGCKRKLKHLEKLSSPLKNFKQLRLTMQPLLEKSSKRYVALVPFCGKLRVVL